ncbi:4-hydroxyphenylacetate 3-hydroxylase C-terminal domain-containing protein [Paenibacillus sp. YIM B09110]|uniref:4-hydroxyphenylacetate 3-hydroxylase C-terminal domain-containing protein n=1 Tax=Paenibacillus sp. YIM B09110 TaxID=3126102 RepID=UPI00301D171E
MTTNKSQETIATTSRRSIRLGEKLIGAAEEHAAYVREWTKVAHVTDNAEHPLREQAYLLPSSLDELRRKRTGYYSLTGGGSIFGNGWADYAHSLLAGWYGHVSLLSSVNPPAAKGRLAVLFQQSLKQRSIITTSLQPIVRKNADLPIVQHTKEGITLHGEQTFDSDALFADELLVFIREQGEAAPASAVLIPVQSAGLELRPNGVQSESLSAGVQVSYEQVAIPRERILHDNDAPELRRLLGHHQVKAIADYQWVSRQLDALELVTGTAFALAELTGEVKELHIQGDLGEVIQNVETLKALIHASEIGADASLTGIVLPSSVPLEAARKAGGLYYAHAVQVLQRIGAGIFLRDQHLLQQRELGEKPTILQLAWRLSGSAEAAKRKLHELHAFGDPIVQSSELFRQYPVQVLRERYKQFWHGIDARSKANPKEAQL